MVKDWVLQTIWLKSVDSTQTYIQDALKNKTITSATMVVSEEQTAGKGSRGNEWIGLKGNLFFSFCLEKNSLPEDLPLSATSIYFSFLLKKILSEFHSSVWMKWPNDFYLDDKKIGGTITNTSGRWFICGIGLNLIQSPKSFSHLDISIDKEKLLEQYQKTLKTLPSWKKLLKDFQIEFTKSKKFSTHIAERKVSLSTAELADDGALIINGQRIYSLR